MPTNAGAQLAAARKGGPISAADASPGLDKHRSRLQDHTRRGSRPEYQQVKGHQHQGLAAPGREKHSQTHRLDTSTCPPNSVHTLVVECTIGTHSGLRGWRSFIGDGGFHSVVDDLYRTLNRFIHFGPRLASTTPLPKPMHIKTVMVQVRAEVADDVVDPQSHAKLRALAHQLRDFVCRQADGGMVLGLVDEFQFQVDGQNLAMVVVANRGNEDVPEACKDSEFGRGAGDIY